MISHINRLCGASGSYGRAMREGVYYLFIKVHPLTVSIEES